MDQPVAIQLPRIGAQFPGQGGVYAGIVRGAENDPDYHLILVDFDKVQGATWQAAKDWAASLSHQGFNDYSLPNRRDQSVLFANAREFFEPAWYWSSEQHPGYSNYAYFQYFGHGHQFSLHSSYEGRARAVRRFLIL